MSKERNQSTAYAVRQPPVAQNSAPKPSFKKKRVFDTSHLPTEAQAKLDVAKRMASANGKPAHIVKTKEGVYSVTLHTPGSIDWRKSKFEWVFSVRP